MQPTFLTDDFKWFDVDFTQDQPPSFTVDPQKILFIVESPILSVEKYTFMNLYYLHILPARQIFCLNQYFQIVGNTSSIKNILGYLTADLSIFFLQPKVREVLVLVIFLAQTLLKS